MLFRSHTMDPKHLEEVIQLKTTLGEPKKRKPGRPAYNMYTKFPVEHWSDEVKFRQAMRKRYGFKEDKDVMKRVD